MARLIISSPDGQRTVELRTQNTLGRHPDNTIQVLDKIVSKNHCVIAVHGDEFVLKDLGSLNGTYGNATRVNGEVSLVEGAEIALGQTRMRFEGARQLPNRAPTPVWEKGQQVAAPPQKTKPPAQPSVAMRPTAELGDHGFRPLGQSSQAPGFPPPLTSSPPARAPLGSAPPSSNPRIGMQTRIDMSDGERQIGQQIDATAKGFLAFDQISANPAQLAQDYERLRLSHELSREIALERDLEVLLGKSLATIFRFVRADRGVIFLREENGELTPGASLRRDGTDKPIPVSSTIMNHVIKERATVLTHDAAMDFAASKGKSMILNRISSAIVAPLLHEDDIVGLLWLDSESLAQFQQKDLEIVTAIANQAAMFIEINILGKKIQQEVVNRERFSRLLSPNIAEKVLSGELKVEKGGALVNRCTVFNSDIRGFTAMSEKASPEEIVDMLNEYFERMVETLFKYEGTLDKFMGDGIMALWGAPGLHPDDALRSVQCALEQIEVLRIFNEERIAAGKGHLDVGFGIHTGPLVAGYIGSSKALSYTVIGDTANTSARLCGIAKPGQVLVSQTTLDCLNGAFAYDELAPVILKNKEKPFRCFNITGKLPA